MKITNVQGFLMSYPMPEEIKLPFWGGVRTVLKRDAMIIKVSTDTDLCGYAPGPAFSRAVVEIDTVIKSFLVGNTLFHNGSTCFRISASSSRLR